MSGVVQQKVIPIVLMAMLSLILLSCANAPEVPLPEELAKQYQKASRPSLSRVDLLLDASMSMQGYAASGVENPLRDLISISEEAAQVSKVKFQAQSFGVGKPVPIGRDVERWGRPEAYHAKDSQIDLALNSIRDAPPGTLSILASDLWFDNRSYTGTMPVALGQPLRRILESGRSVAVLGTKVPFSGTVYDMPGVGSWNGAKERVLLLLIVGEEQDIRNFVTSLHQSQSPSFAAARTRLALFRPDLPPVLQSAKIRSSGAGIKAQSLQSNTPRFEIDWSDAGREAAPGLLRAAFDRAPLNSADTSWHGPVATRTRLWVKREGQWHPWPLKGKQWRILAPPKEGAVFAFGPATVGQLPEGEYLLAGEIGATGVTRGQPSTAWMREWSLPAEPGRPAFVKALGLATLADVLEAAVDRPRIDEGFILYVTVKD